MKISAKNTNYDELNRQIREAGENCEISDCLGQRFIGAGMTDHEITITGTPGNALGAYLNGARITVYGNAQDAVGDTMNDGSIIIDGNIGDTAGYAMRGGRLIVKGNAGYRSGVHMKAYKEKMPVLVIGGRAGSFLGEYQAGGLIIVLGLNEDGKSIVGNFPCTGMHGGKVFLRSDCKDIEFPSQVKARTATREDMAEIEPYIAEYCSLFKCGSSGIIDSKFIVVIPDSKNPYKQMYVAN